MLSCCGCGCCPNSENGYKPRFGCPLSLDFYTSCADWDCGFQSSAELAQQVWQASQQTYAYEKQLREFKAQLHAEKKDQVQKDWAAGTKGVDPQEFACRLLGNCGQLLTLCWIKKSKIITITSLLFRCSIPLETLIFKYFRIEKGSTRMMLLSS